MPSALNHHSATCTKTLFIGDSGAGKTGALASLVAAGYNVRMLDFDNGADSVVNLLTDRNFPYRDLIDARGIDLNTAFLYTTINEKMRANSAVNEKRFVPASAEGWAKMIDMTEKWIDGDLNLGGIDTWGEKDILVFDTFGTLAFLCYFFVQKLNSRLGARMEGYDYQRDVGTAQNLLENLLQKVYSIHVRCNVLIISHITTVDDSRGMAQMPDRENRSALNLKGYPAAIGRALSPKMGKYFNNVLLAKQSGSGRNVRREIITLPQDNVFVKNARPAALEQRYPVESGLAEIFAALRGEPIPTELIAALRPKNITNPGATAANGPAPLQRAGARP